MERDRAVESAMIDFNSNFPLVDESLRKHIRHLFGLLWSVGYEHRSMRMGGHNVKPVEQRTKDDRLLKVWPSVMEAATTMKCSYDYLQRCIRAGKPTHNGKFYWKYVNKGKSTNGTDKDEQE